MTDPRPAIRIYLLDDHEIVRRGLRDLFEAEGDLEIVGESGSAVEAESRIPALRPHVAVLDARLPDGSGIDVCREIRSVDPTISVLILTSYDDDEALFAAIMAGASGYALKQIDSTDLVSSVRQVASGKSMLDPAVTAPVRGRDEHTGTFRQSGARGTDRLLSRMAKPRDVVAAYDQEVCIGCSPNQHVN